MTRMDLRDWAEIHLKVTMLTRERLRATFTPMLALRCSKTRDVVGMLLVPREQVAAVSAAAAREEKATALALCLDTWLGPALSADSVSPTEGNVLGVLGGVRDIPGSTDALAVVAMTAEGTRLLWTVRYVVGPDAEVCFGTPELMTGHVHSPLLPPPWRGGSTHA